MWSRYRLSFENDDPSNPSREVQQRWVNRLMRVGLGGDIEEAKRIEEEKKWEEAEAARKREEAEAEEFARQALGLGVGGSAAGGGAAGGAQDVFQQVNQAKDTLNDNIQKLSEMADKTEEMRHNAMVRSRRHRRPVSVVLLLFDTRASRGKTNSMLLFLRRHVCPWLHTYDRTSVTWPGKCERGSRSATNAAGCFNEPQLDRRTPLALLAQGSLQPPNRWHAPLGFLLGTIASHTTAVLLRCEIWVHKVGRHRGSLCLSSSRSWGRGCLAELRVNKLAR